MVRTDKRLASTLAFLSLSVLAPAGARAEAEPSVTVDVPLGGSKHIQAGAPIQRVTVATREVADVAAFPPDDLLITGKQLGVTQLTTQSRTGTMSTMTVHVVLPTEGLRDRLRALFPDQKIEVHAVGTSVILAGQVKDVMTSNEIERVAASFVALFAQGGGQLANQLRVTNLLQVGGTPQVQLEVRFAEVSRTVGRAIGFNFWTRTGTGRSDVVAGMLAPGTLPSTGLAPDLGAGGAAMQQPNGMPVIANPVQSAFNILVATSTSSVIPLSGTLSLMASRGFAKVLAEPTLVALSGEEASFLAGGEFPVPIPQGLGQVSIQYRKFGIGLRFLPFVLGDNTVQLKLDTNVSEIDDSLGVRLAQVTVPGLTQRESQTTVRLRDGQSFAIAGLLSDKMRSSVAKFPLLGDIPVLGALFRSNNFTRSETELMVVVTVHLVTPNAPGEHIQVPGEDEVSAPSDLQLFLLGTVESHKKVPVGRVGFMR